MMYALLAWMPDTTGLTPYQKFWVGLAMLAVTFYLVGRRPKKWI